MRRIAIVVALGLFVGACSSSSTETTGQAISTQSTPSTAAVTTTSAPVGSSTSESSSEAAASEVVEEQIDWFVRAANGAPVDEAVYEDRFAQDFRNAVPFESFIAGLDSLSEVPGDWLVVRVDETGPGSVSLLLAAGDEQVQTSMSIDENRQISGLLIQPANLPSTPASMEEAYAQVDLGSAAHMLAADIEGTECVPTFERSADEPMPLGSVFKLYVLGTLARQIDAGVTSWDDEITITDELKSIPSGVLQEEPDGTVRSVEEVAELMISISDNTATDLLIDHLGRQTIEESLDDLGMTDPSPNVPFLTTRELTALKVGPSAGLRTQYLDADVAGKRRILEQISGITAADLPVTDLVEPIQPDRLEWFATPIEVCRLMAFLWHQGGTAGLEPLRRILTVNPGIAPPPGRWDAVAYKGGSEPGLVAVAWLVVDENGQQHVLTGAVVDPESVLPELDIVYAFAGARDLLGDSTG